MMTTWDSSMDEQGNMVSDKDTEKLYRDFVKLIKKYSGFKTDVVNTLAMSDHSTGDIGFYMLFVKTNAKLPENERVQISTFGQHMSVADLIYAFTTILKETMEDKPIANA